MALSFGGVLAALVANDKSEETLNSFFGKRIFNGFSKIGTYSYGIYLFHMMIIWYAIPIKPEPNYNAWGGRFNAVVLFIIVLLVGMIATEWIEKPILKWRNKVIK